LKPLDIALGKSRPQVDDRHPQQQGLKRFNSPTTVNRQPLSTTVIHNNKD